MGAEFHKTITAVVESTDDNAVLTITFEDINMGGGSISQTAITSVAVPQAGSVADNENDATQVESRPASHVQSHSIGNAR